MGTAKKILGKWHLSTEETRRVFKQHDELLAMVRDVNRILGAAGWPEDVPLRLEMSALTEKCTSELT